VTFALTATTKDITTKAVASATKDFFTMCSPFQQLINRVISNLIQLEIVKRRT
jgi:hypothetical protein